jgi:hypothetical protein
MARVYFWGELDWTGHVSVDTSVGYVSFHPSDSVNNPNHREAGKIRHNIELFFGHVCEPRFANFNEDCRELGSPASYVDLDFDDEAIESYLLPPRRGAVSSFSLEFSKYRLWSTNCSSAAAAILLTGFKMRGEHKRILDSVYHHLLAKFSRDESLMSNPSGRILESFRDTAEIVLPSIRNPRRIPWIFSFFLADIAQRSITWTPGAVKSLAKHLGKHHN